MGEKDEEKNDKVEKSGKSSKNKEILGKVIQE